MTSRNGGSGTGRAGSVAGCALAIALTLSLPATGQQIIPPDFFSRIPAAPAGDMAVAADTMVFDSRTDRVTAQGRVGISFEGYRLTADRAIYHQRTGRVELVGNVAMVDPEGIEYLAERVELEDGFREAFLRSLIVALPDGSRFTAAETRIDEGVERVFIAGTYAPCGTCIDAQGNRIGWSVRAARIVSNEADAVIYFEQPTLELLGVPIVSLPWLTLPTDPGLRFPVLSYDESYGVGLTLPFFRYPIAQGTLAVTPALYSNQGPGLTLDWRQATGDLSYSVTGSGVYQFNPDAYSGLAARNFRGALQTSGTFTPTPEWTLGWSHTAFTDPGYLPDYRIASGTARNQVHATYLDPDTHADIRVQQFLPLGNQETQAEYEALRDRQALTHPNARFDRVIDLEGDAGRIELAGRLLGLTRRADHVEDGLFFGYAGQSVHAMMQAGWTNRYIVPGGLAVSPYLGLRADGAGHDGQSALPGAPEGSSLLSATPIAALDIRYPLMARTPGATHVIEPIAQLVYRGGPAIPGIANDDSQSLIFEDTSLFSFNRFSGADRQETGLRANVGGQVQTSFADGGWLSALVGQSFHLAGENAFSIRDGTPVGIGSGLDADVSSIVAGIQGGYHGLSGGAKAQIDPANATIPRAQIAASAAFASGHTLSADYFYAARIPDLGMDRARHEIGVDAEVPLADYWTLSTGVAWDLSAAQWLETSAGVQYDDSYLAFGVGARATGPTHITPDDLRIAVNFRLRGPERQELVGIDFDFGEF